MVQKLVTVLGATGIQGGSLVTALLTDDRFRVRGVTRNVEGEKARALAQKGVEMVTAWIEDVSSLERAFEGSYGIFGVTNYWEILDEAKEVQMGKNIVDAAKRVGVQHLIYSGHPSIEKLTGMSCPHFDGKAAVEEYLFQSGLSCTSVRYPTYMENIFTSHIPQKTGEKEYVWNFPVGDKPVYFLAATSAGPAVAAIFRDPEKYRGKTVGLSGDKKTIQQFCDVINKYVAPVKVVPGKETAEQFGKRDFPGAEELGVMFMFLQTDFPDYGIEQTKLLDPETMDIESFVKANLDKFAALLK